MASYASYYIHELLMTNDETNNETTEQCNQYNIISCATGSGVDPAFCILYMCEFLRGDYSTRISSIRRDGSALPRRLQHFSNFRINLPSFELFCLCCCIFAISSAAIFISPLAKPCFRSKSSRTDLGRIMASLLLGSGFSFSYKLRSYVPDSKGFHSMVTGGPLETDGLSPRVWP